MGIQRGAGEAEAPNDGELGEALRRSEAQRVLCEGRLELLQQAASLGFWDWHIPTNDLYWSDELFTIFGLSKSSFGATYEAFLERVHPDDRERVEQSVEAAFNNAESYEIDHRIVRPDGVILDLRESGRVVFDPDGIPQRMLGAVLDVTERKKAERSLVQSEAKFRHLWESAYNGMIIVNTAGEITMVNRSAERLFLYSEEELIGKKVEFLVPDRFRVNHTTLRKGYQRCPQARAMGEQSSLFALRRDGSEFNVEISLTPLGGDSDSSVLIEIQDVSERKALESQLRQSQRLESLGRLAGGVAHDLNNVLTAVMGFSEICLMNLGESHACSDDLREVLSASEHAKSLIDQLLAFSRQQILQPEVLDLNAAISNTVRLLERLLCEHIRLDTDFDQDLGNIRVDPNQLEQILVNLAVNASDAMADRGCLTITTRDTFYTADTVPLGSKLAPGRFALLSFRDTGVGMSDAVISHVFEPFYTTKGLEKGTGLGLATVYGIVEQSGGYIEVDSAEGCGTTFTLYFPTTEAVPAQHRPSPQVGPSNPGEGVILLVEDDTKIRAFAGRVLEAQGYTVHTAADGKGALEKMTALKSIDLVISDVVLPDTRGPKLIQDILAGHPDLPVLFVSGYGAGEEELTQVLTSQVEFLPKPFSGSTLLEKVMSMMG